MGQKNDLLADRMAKHVWMVKVTLADGTAKIPFMYSYQFMCKARLVNLHITGNAQRICLMAMWNKAVLV